MNPEEEHRRLVEAAAAVRQGDNSKARSLIISVLKEDPRSELAWSWACQVAQSPAERIHCLEQILALNPDHARARRYLQELQAAPSPGPAPAPITRRREDGDDNPRNPGIGGMLFAPLGCLLQASATHLVVALLALTLVGGIIYFNANTDFLGMAGPDFNSMAVSSSKNQVEANDLSWKITYEKPGDSRFAGLVRHVSPIRHNTMRILTHDILVTSGEYADSGLVHTRVSNHRFYWHSNHTAHPQGSINLLHTVPANQEIYHQLRDIRAQDEVVITGREILIIEAYDQAGNYLGEWHDSGCNTLMVESVSVVEE